MNELGGLSIVEIAPAFCNRAQVKNLMGGRMGKSDASEAADGTQAGSDCDCDVQHFKFS